MKAKVLDTLNKLSTKAENIYGISVPKFEVKYTLRTGLGKVTFKRLTKEITMKLNEGLLYEFGDAYIEEVVIHELAHVIVRGIYPNDINGRRTVKSHGREFKSVCTRLGYSHVSGATTETFNKSKHIEAKTRQTTKFTYKCNCQTFELSKIRHNRILKGASYSCGKCRTTLVKG